VKPRLSVTGVRELLAAVLGRQPSAVEQLIEGLESQAFRFRLDGQALVLRVNPSLRGFEKDRWADANVGRRVPVPRIVALGWADEGLAYCVSEWLPGTTLEHLREVDVLRVVDAGGRVTGVVDWESEMARDPLYDVANTYFWAAPSAACSCRPSTSNARCATYRRITTASTATPSASGSRRRGKAWLRATCASRSGR